MSTPDRLRPAPFVAGLAGGATVILVGAWLVVAPFAVGYQPSGAEWVDATIVGIASGVAVILLGLLVLLAAAAALRAELRRRGLAPGDRTATAEGERDDDRDDADDEPQVAHDGDLDTVLASLAAALLEDVRNGHRDPRPDTTPVVHPAPPAGRLTT